MRYKAVCKCKDGSYVNFHFESNHRIVRNNQINLMTNPLLNEVWGYITERKNNPKSKLNQRGYDKLVKIVNESTGTVQYYDLW